MIKPTSLCKIYSEKFYRLMDQAYRAFLNNEAPYNRPGEAKDSLFDRNWLGFISDAQNTADKFLMDMGLNEDEIFNIDRDFNFAFSDDEFAKAVEKNSELYNIHIAELIEFVNKLGKDMSERYVYVDREEFAENKKPVQEWINAYQEGQPNWRHTTLNINFDLSIDTDGDISIGEKDLVDGKLPVKFRKVNGNFYCNHIGLQALHGCPDIVEESFLCYNNNLTSLLGGPKIVKKKYDCSNNKLTSLEGAPEGEMYQFNCSCNLLNSLTGAPRIVSNFLCGHNKLTSLIGSPDVVKFEFDCCFNDIVSLEGCPKQIGHIRDLSGQCTDNDNYLEFYPQGSYEECGYFIAGNNPKKWTKSQLKKMCPNFYAKVNCRSK